MNTQAYNKYGLRKSKHFLTTQDWLRTIAHIEEIISREEMELLVQKTRAEITEYTSNQKCGIAWSGGKDSQVVRYLCEPLGITSSVICISDLEYPAFVRWVSQYGPKDLYRWNPGYNLTWLAAHQSFLFPTDHKQFHPWMPAFNWLGQEVFFQQDQLDIILCGRRKADNNYAGPNKNGSYVTRKGTHRYSPIFSWSHEELLAFLHYNRIPLPPVYNYVDGWMVATGPWPKRIVPNYFQGWQEVYQNDPSVVHNAASSFISAQLYLETNPIRQEVPPSWHEAVYI